MEQRAVLRQVSEAATNELQLQCLPVRSVVEVRVDYDGRSGSRTGSFPTSGIKRQGQDYWANRDVIDGSGNPVCRDGVLRTIGLWPTTPGTVKVEYTAGYSDAEFRGEDGVVDASPIWASILDETCRRVRYVLGMKKGTRGLPMGVMSNESLGEYSYSMDAESVKRLQSGTLLPDTVNRLSSFVNWGWSLGS